MFHNAAPPFVPEEQTPLGSLFSFIIFIFLFPFVSDTRWYCCTYISALFPCPVFANEDTPEFPVFPPPQSQDKISRVGQTDRVVTSHTHTGKNSKRQSVVFIRKWGPRKTFIKIEILFTLFLETKLSQDFYTIKSSHSCFSDFCKLYFDIWGYFSTESILIMLGSVVYIKALPVPIWLFFEDPIHEFFYYYCCYLLVRKEWERTRKKGRWTSIGTHLLGRCKTPLSCKARHVGEGLKGQCHEMNIFFEGLKYQISNFCIGADGF